MHREYALQERDSHGSWITLSRHRTASDAADAYFGKGGDRPGRIVEVDDYEVVRIGQADERDINPFKDFSRSKLIAALDATAKEAANG